MLRIYKHYAIKLKDTNAGNVIVIDVCKQIILCSATEVMSFSSYPAYLSSLDDFYMMDRYQLLQSWPAHVCIHFAVVW